MTRMWRATATMYMSDVQ